jgi:hypothetical protein
MVSARVELVAAFVFVNADAAVILWGGGVVCTYRERRAMDWEIWRFVGRQKNDERGTINEER